MPRALASTWAAPRIPDTGRRSRPPRRARPYGEGSCWSSGWMAAVISGARSVALPRPPQASEQRSLGQVVFDLLGHIELAGIETNPGEQGQRLDEVRADLFGCSALG